ncbi:hypothetical protein C0995_005834 [Termitomyces sp. Mi166|nr:hypothetical protein C0995_005834 [Termitomyces sp. Mi166\
MDELAVMYKTSSLIVEDSHLHQVPQPFPERRKSSSTVAAVTMILETPKKLLSVAKAFSPAWLMNLSPARLFTTDPTPDESMILDPPTWPSNVARDEFWENGGPISPQRRLKRCYGPNGSFHRSIHLKQLEANRAWNTYQKKRSRYEAQQARQKRLEELNHQPFKLDELHNQAVQQLRCSDDPEDLIFLRELGRLRDESNNLEKLAPVVEVLEYLEKRREERHARAEYEILSARKPHAVPSFTSFQRERRNKAVREAAVRKRQQQRTKPSAEEERREKRRKETDKRKKEYEEERAKEREAARAYMEKVKEQAYCEEIRIALEQGRPPPDHLQHRQDLIQEMSQLVSQAALHRQREAALRAKVEREQRFAREQEARRRAEEEATRRAEELKARRRAEEERARANAELFARRKAKLAQERAAREAEKRRQEQEEAARRRAEAAAREEEARRAREEARQIAEEEARHRQAQEEQARHAADQIFKLYDDKWAALRGTEVYSNILFAQFPWPVLFQISDISGITLDSVRAFFAHRGTTGKAMKAEILKWHPDKLNHQLHQVYPEHREQVREAGELVAKFLNAIMEN